MMILLDCLSLSEMGMDMICGGIWGCLYASLNNECVSVSKFAPVYVISKLRPDSEEGKSETKRH